MHTNFIHILSILQLIQEDVLENGNDKNEKEEVIKRKIPYILKRQLYENKPRRPYILKRGSYYYWENICLHVIVTYHSLIKYQIIFVWKCDKTELFCLCYIVVYWMWFFCININWAKCFQINLDLEDDVLCIIGVDIYEVTYRMFCNFTRNLMGCLNSQNIWHFKLNCKRL